MLIDTNGNDIIKSRCWSASLNKDKIIAIKNFLKGGVYSHCNRVPNEMFTASSFAGGKSYYWFDTPLQELWDYYYHTSGDEDYSFNQSRTDIGCILKEMLIEDKRRIYRQEDETRFTGALMYSYVKDIPDCTH